MINQVLPRSCRGVRRGERLTNCAGPRRDEPRYNAFTLIELILVVGIIIVLAGLVLSTVGYARKKGARARAETEIAAMSAACENYKADNGVYPTQLPTTNGLECLNATDNPTGNDQCRTDQHVRVISRDDCSSSGDITDNRNADRHQELYVDSSRTCSLPAERHEPVTAIRDPFGNSYGYSTMRTKLIRQHHGYNPTFDLWSTALTDSRRAQPIKISGSKTGKLL